LGAYVILKKHGVAVSGLRFSSHCPPPNISDPWWGATRKTYPCFFGTPFLFFLQFDRAAPCPTQKQADSRRQFINGFSLVAVSDFRKSMFILSLYGKFPGRLIPRRTILPEIRGFFGVYRATLPEIRPSNALKQAQLRLEVGTQNARGDLCRFKCMAAVSGLRFSSHCPPRIIPTRGGRDVKDLHPVFSRPVSQHVIFPPVTFNAL
jgi:hypothetical protein